MGSNMHGLKCDSCRFWQRNDVQTTTECFMPTPRDAYPGAQTCCASPTQTPARLANSRRTWSRRRTRKSKCVPSRWKVLSGEFRRRPTALAIKFRKSDRVGRRGLSEPREDFSRLLTYAFPWRVSAARFHRTTARRRSI